MSLFESIRNRLRDHFAIRSEVARLKSTAESLPGGLQCVFYAESKNDWIYFEGLILELLEQRAQDVVYLTSSADDTALDFEHERFHPFYIGEGVARTVLFKSIDCKVFVMTLTDLDQLFLKRSMHDVHYVYLFHAIVSAHMVYREKSFNGYDTFLAVGPHHERELEALHRFYDVPRKNVLPFGYYRLEKLIRENAERPENAAPAEGGEATEGPEILIAPSWGDHSITRTVLVPLIQELRSHGNRVTFRPHPMSFRRDEALLEEATNRFSEDSGVRFDFDIRNTDSLRRADLMISDWSGSALEFAFGLEKPVLFVDTEPKINNADFEAFSAWCEKQDGEALVPIEKSLRTVLGDTLSPDRLSEAGDKIQRLLEDREATRTHLRKCRDEYVYHLGRSSAVGADALLDLLERT